MDVIKFSDEISKIIPDNCAANKLVSGFIFSEGPVWDMDSESIIFTDFTPHKIFKWNKIDGLSIFREQSGRAVGLTMDADGRILCCETQGRRISRIEKNGEVVSLASHYDGKRLNSPNDVIVKSDGTVYFTDPYSTAMGDTKELTGNGVYKVAPETGEVTLLGNFNRPNGLAFSPDEKLLYIDDTNLQNVQVFEVTEAGTLKNGRLFAQLDTGAGKGAADGMKVDSQGNVYVTGPGGIWIYAANGEKLGLLRLPEVAANLCWGGQDWRTLFITATTSVYSVYLNIPGIPTGKLLKK